jgi:hypothetical protein
MDSYVLDESSGSLLSNSSQADQHVYITGGGAHVAPGLQGDMAANNIQAVSCSLPCNLVANDPVKV